MKHFALAVILAALASACQPVYESHSPYSYYERPKEHYMQFVNAVDYDAKADRSKWITVVNKSYPIEVSLFRDGRFHYHLEKLGDGVGKWKYDRGSLSLFAERDIFVMQMWIKSIDPESNDVTINFQDRFSWKFLPLEMKGKTKF